jgi:hypothetical protein
MGTTNEASGCKLVAVSQFWSNLSSGTLGVFLGAIVTGVVTWRVTSRQTTRLLDEQREAAAEERQAAWRDHLHRREERAVASLLPVLSELQECASPLTGLATTHAWSSQAPVPGPSPAVAQRAEHAYESMVRALHVGVPLVTNEDFRQQYRALVDLVQQLYEDKVETQHEDRARGDVIRYSCHIRHCVKRLLHGQPLPEAPRPPELNRAGDQALWSATEPDPEDMYFPDPRAWPTP